MICQRNGFYHNRWNRAYLVTTIYWNGGSHDTKVSVQYEQDTEITMQISTGNGFVIYFLLRTQQNCDITFNLGEKCYVLGPLLLTWFILNLSMDM